MVLNSRVAVDVGDVSQRVYSLFLDQKETKNLKHLGASLIVKAKSRIHASRVPFCSQTAVRLVLHNFQGVTATNHYQNPVVLKDSVTWIELQGCSIVVVSGQESCLRIRVTLASCYNQMIPVQPQPCEDLLLPEGAAGMGSSFSTMILGDIVEVAVGVTPHAFRMLSPGDRSLSLRHQNVLLASLITGVSRQMCRKH